MRFSDIFPWYGRVRVTFGVDGRGRGVAGLQHVQGTTHVTTGKLQQGFSSRIGDLHTLEFDDVVDTLAEGGNRERGETEAGTTGQEGGIKLVCIVRNYAESGVGSISAKGSIPLRKKWIRNEENLLLHDSSQRILRRTGHCIRFIKNN